MSLLKFPVAVEDPDLRIDRISPIMCIRIRHSALPMQTKYNVHDRTSQKDAGDSPWKRFCGWQRRPSPLLWADPPESFPGISRWIPSPPTASPWCLSSFPAALLGQKHKRNERSPQCFDPALFAEQTVYDTTHERWPSNVTSEQTGVCKYRPLQNSRLTWLLKNAGALQYVF